MRERTLIIQDRGHKTWHIFLVSDDDETALQFIERRREEYSIVMHTDYGEILKSGQGEVPTEEDFYSVVNKIYANNSINFARLLV